MNSLMWFRAAAEFASLPSPHMRPHTTTPILLLVALLTDCTTAPKRPPSQVSTLPDELYFQSVGLPNVNITKYRLTRDGILTLTHEAMESSGTIKKTMRRRVTPEAWRSFEQRVASLRITHWKRSYEPHVTFFDGYNWEFRWISEHTRIESGGSNAGPDPKNPSKTVEGLTGPETADMLLSKALSELWEHSISAIWKL